MNIPKKNKNNLSSTVKNSKSGGLLVEDYSEAFSGGIILDLTRWTRRYDK